MSGAEMFEGFADERVDVGEVVLRVRHRLTDPARTPVLLVHGHPRTGATWHQVARRLVERGHDVVVPDMRGYGASTSPDPLPDHRQQSKRAVAGDLVRLLDVLDVPRVVLAGHDRGCYVALRLALDHPDRVAALGVLDGVPISEALARCDARFAAAWPHWFFFAMPDKPERAILADPLAWYAPSSQDMGAVALAELEEALVRPQVVRAMLEDYRAGLGVDRADEEADRAAGRRLRMPTTFARSRDDDLAELYGEPVRIWQDWADDVVEVVVGSGHHMAEEAPGEVTDLLADLAARAR
ncbi:alpha/beta hydrolase [Janibacter melonis]|uniref:alpha/beta fold hydrolase n=1 Tax=Janibacter melonis TaxID=262209 RepID=UPI001E41794E|nr:alpha/beta hydrolase [Janibacter melonis]MCB5990334.1 alpha/beta hydrolase [Janibacter melonis]